MEGTKQIYEAERKRFAENSVVEYMKKAQRRLDEEEQWVWKCLHADTALRLKTACHQVLVAEHSDSLRAGFQTLLDSDREEDMARMFTLLSRVPYGLEPLLSKFGTHLRKAGPATVVKAAYNAKKLEPKVHVGPVHIRY